MTLLRRIRGVLGTSLTWGAFLAGLALVSVLAFAATGVGGQANYIARAAAIHNLANEHRATEPRTVVVHGERSGELGLFRLHPEVGITV